MAPPNAKKKAKQRRKQAKQQVNGVDDPDHYDDHNQALQPNSPQDDQYDPSVGAHPTMAKSKPKKIPQSYAMPPAIAPRAAVSDETLRTMQRRVASKDPIWDTNSTEERARIKEFWLTLPEDDRKSLVKIEKEAVLRKMKEQQKHSCSCTVCGRKRTAIEEELEVLYDAYYEELEQFANHNQQMSENGTPMLPPGSHVPHPLGRGPPDRPSSKHSRGRIHELRDDDEEDDLDDEEDLNDDDVDDDPYSEDYDDEYASNLTDEAPDHQTPANDFFSFGKSLTVKGGILTVADDLLKNDGQKFIDMMEQLAERRMQREEDAAMGGPYRSMPHPSMAPSHPHTHPPPEEDEDSYEDEDYDDESQADDLEDEDDEMDTMTEEQRMEEGRRMFQIFAARMFEQRVLTAYKEKVARDRQEKLIAELEAETNADTARDAKKARDAEKRRLKKAQQKAVKAEEKARKDAEKLKEEEAAKEAERARQDDLKKKRDEAKKRKEAERKAADEERLRKEAEKLRRQQAERERQQETERKAREAKAEEKRKREEVQRRAREDKETRDAEQRRRKDHVGHDKRFDIPPPKSSATADVQTSLEDKQKADASLLAAAVAHKTNPTQPVPPGPQAARSAPSSKVAMPPGIKQASSHGQPSPQPKVAVPAVPKAATPNKARDSGSQATTHSRSGSGEMMKPGEAASPKSSNLPHDLHPRAQSHLGQAFTPLGPAIHSMGPPPGMPQPLASPIPGFPGAHMAGGLYGSPQPQGGPMIPPGMGPRVHANQQIPGFMPGQQQGPYAHRGFGMPPPGSSGFPPGMAGGQPGIPNLFRGFHEGAFHGQAPVSGGNVQVNYPGQQHTSTTLPSHSRQPSASYEASAGPPRHPEPHAAPGLPGHGALPIARPAPIKRPASVKPRDDADIDELGKHLGSSALLDDTDEPLPPNGLDARRPGGTPTIGAASGRPTPFAGPHLEASPGPFPHVTARVPSSDSWGRSGGNATAGASHHGFPGTPGLPSTPGWGAPAPAGPPGWGSHGPYGSNSLPRAGMARPAAIRQATCHACRNLVAKRGHMIDGGFSGLDEIVHEIQLMGTLGNNSTRPEEITDILDTEGDAHNGGGAFEVRQDMQGRLLVKWEPEGGFAVNMNGRVANLGGLGIGPGEIGSPVPGNSLPNLGGRF